MRRASGAGRTAAVLAVGELHANPCLLHRSRRGSISGSPNAGQGGNPQGVADAGVTSALWEAVTPSLTQKSRGNHHCSRGSVVMVALCRAWCCNAGRYPVTSQGTAGVRAACKPKE